MNIDKCIELLRFYVTGKISETNALLEDTLIYGIDDVVSSVLASIFSLYFSHEFINCHGWLGAILRVIAVVVLFLGLKVIIKRLRKYFKARTYLKKIDDNNIDFAEAMSYISKFDHIACDGILVSQDFLCRYENKSGKSCSENESLFYLIEAFYYYKKALSIVCDIVKYSKYCINSPTLTNGVSQYRLINVYNSLNEIEDKIENNISKLDFEGKNVFINELNFNNEKLEKIKNFIEKSR